MGTSGLARMGPYPYQPTSLVQFFHKFPHVDVKFHSVNSTFNPRSNSYVESLGLLSAAPAFWLILNLLTFLLFLLSRCCRRRWAPKDVTPLRWSLAITTLLSSLCIGVGFYGTMVTHHGTQDLVIATEGIGDTLDSIKNKTLSIEDSLDQTIAPTLTKLSTVFRRPISNTTAYESLQTALRAMNHAVGNGSSQVRGINDRVRTLGFRMAPRQLEMMEEYRYPVTFGVLGVLLFFCVIGWLTACMRSRCMLGLFTVFCLLASITTWGLVSIYTGSCVGLSDFCMDPDTFVIRQAPPMLDQKMMIYYLECVEGMDNPFGSVLRQGQKSISTMENKLGQIQTLSSQYYPSQGVQPLLTALKQGVQRTEKAYQEVSALLDCQVINRDYQRALRAGCGVALDGLAFLLLSAFTTGLFYLVLTWLASHAWIHIGQKKDYVRVEDNDPFLPNSNSNRRVAGGTMGRGESPYNTASFRPPKHHTPPQTPFSNTYNGRLPRGMDEHSVYGRYTPPPLIPVTASVGSLLRPISTKLPGFTARRPRSDYFTVPARPSFSLQRPLTASFTVPEVPRLTDAVRGGGFDPYSVPEVYSKPRFDSFPDYELPRALNASMEPLHQSTAANTSLSTIDSQDSLE